MKKPADAKPKKNVVKITSEHTEEQCSSDFAQVRQQIQNRVGLEAMGMVQAAIDAARDGQYAAMKFLFEMVGLFPAATQESTADDDTLVKRVLQHLGLPEIPELEHPVTKDT